MLGTTSFLKATALSVSLGLAATAAHAANIVDTAKQNGDLGTFVKALETAGVDQQLTGKGPYTVFAPSDEAFEQLPQGTVDELMKQENRSQLTKLLQEHVVNGQKIAAKDVLGEQTKVDTVAGDSLTVDGTSAVVLVVPTGLTITRIGDRVVVEREGVAVPAGAIEVQEQVVRKAGASNQQGAAGAKQQAQAQQTQGQQQMAARTPVTEGSDMPATKHQEEVLKSEPGQEQRQTAPQGSVDVPATKHQRQVLAEGELPGQQQQSYEQARVHGKPDILREATVVEPDIQADNGVIHVIDAVLLPQGVREILEGSKQGQG
jgi:uncharacterized surface protein with fasciclin (FAS1) repeats